MVSRPAGCPPGPCTPVAPEPCSRGMVPCDTWVQAANATIRFPLPRTRGDSRARLPPVKSKTSSAAASEPRQGGGGAADDDRLPGGEAAVVAGARLVAGGVGAVAARGGPDGPTVGAQA